MQIECQISQILDNQQLLGQRIINRKNKKIKEDFETNQSNIFKFTNLDSFKQIFIKSFQQQFNIMQTNINKAQLLSSLNDYNNFTIINQNQFIVPLKRKISIKVQDKQTLIQIQNQNRHHIFKNLVIKNQKHNQNYLFQEIAQKVVNIQRNQGNSSLERQKSYFFPVKINGKNLLLSKNEQNIFFFNFHPVIKSHIQFLKKQFKFNKNFNHDVSMLQLKNIVLIQKNVALLNLGRPFIIERQNNFLYQKEIIQYLHGFQVVRYKKSFFNSNYAYYLQTIIFIQSLNKTFYCFVSSQNLSIILFHSNLSKLQDFLNKSKHYQQDQFHQITIQCFSQLFLSYNEFKLQHIIKNILTIKNQDQHLNQCIKLLKQGSTFLIQNFKFQNQLYDMVEYLLDQELEKYLLVKKKNSAFQIFLGKWSHYYIQKKFILFNNYLLDKDKNRFKILSNIIPGEFRLQIIQYDYLQNLQVYKMKRTFLDPKFPPNKTNIIFEYKKQIKKKEKLRSKKKLEQNIKIIMKYYEQQRSFGNKDQAWKCLLKEYENKYSLKYLATCFGQFFRKEINSVINPNKAVQVIWRMYSRLSVKKDVKEITGLMNKGIYQQQKIREYLPLYLEKSNIDVIDHNYIYYSIS